MCNLLLSSAGTWKIVAKNTIGHFDLKWLRAEGYKVVFSSQSYDEAQYWLLEDEYEPIEGRLGMSELL